MLIVCKYRRGSSKICVCFFISRGSDDVFEVAFLPLGCAGDAVRTNAAAGGAER